MNQLQFGIKVGMNARQYHTEAIKLQNRQIALNQALARSPQSAKLAANGLSQLERQTDRTADAIQRLSHYGTAGFVGFQLLGSAIQKAINSSNTAAQIQDVRTRLIGLTQSTQDYLNVEQYLVDLSDSHNKNQLALADSFSRILTLEKSGIVTRREAQQVLEGFSNIQSKAGASTEQLKQSLFGLSQGLSSGTLRAEELNQVTEPLPGLLQELDNAAGLASGGFRRMVNDGKVTSDFFKQTLIEAFKAYEGAAKATSDNISAAHARHQNAYLQLVKAYENPISDSTKFVLSTSGAAMELFADNVDTVSTLLEGTFVLAMAHGAGATQRLTAAKYSSVKATQAAKAATIADLRAKEARLVALHREIVQEKLGHKRMLENARSAEIRSAAVTKLAASNHLVRQSEQALTATRNQLTAATQRQAIATKTLSKASALLGGPAGIFTLAAFATYQWATSTEKAKDNAEALTSSIAKTEQQLDSLTQKQLKVKLLTFDDEHGIKQAEDRLRVLKAQEEYNRVQAARGFSNPNGEGARKQASRDAEIEQLELKLKEASTLRQKINDILNSPAPKPSGGSPQPTGLSQDALSKELEKITQSLLTQEQVINQSYIRRRDIVEQSFNQGQIDQGRYNQLTLSLELQKDEQLRQLNEQAQAKKDQAEVNARKRSDQRKKDAQDDELARLRGFKNRLAEEEQAHLDRKRAVLWENELLALRGFNTRKEAEEYAHIERKQAIVWENELLALEGFHTRKEQAEQAHKDRMLDIQLKNAGEYGGVVKKFVEFDRASGADRVATGLDIAGQLTSIGANQSKKAFELNKKVNIAQAMVSTYMGAAKALELGPIAGPIAASVVIGMGLANVAQIRAQQFQGQAHDGIGFVPAANEGTWKLKRGEMVMNPTQRDNFEVLLDYVRANQRQYNQQSANNAGSGGNVYNFPAMNIKFENDNSTAELQAQNADKMYRLFVNKLITDIDKNGPVGRKINSVRRSA